MVARYAAILLYSSGEPARDRSSIGCGLIGWLTAPYPFIRLITCIHSSASWVDFTMRSRVWQLVQSSSADFCCSVPGMLIIHSALVSWSGRFLVGCSLRSTLVVLSAATSVAPDPARS